MIQEQPSPEFFYKSFLELDICNLTTILSFDSKSMKALLDEKHRDLFIRYCPIFYVIKNNHLVQNRGLNYVSAIDIALQNNQIIALDLITDFMAIY